MINNLLILFVAFLFLVPSVSALKVISPYRIGESSGDVCSCCDDPALGIWLNDTTYIYLNASFPQSVNIKVLNATNATLQNLWVYTNTTTGNLTVLGDAKVKNLTVTSNGNIERLLATVGTITTGTVTTLTSTTGTITTGIITTLRGNTLFNGNWLNISKGNLTSALVKTDNLTVTQNATINNLTVIASSKFNGPVFIESDAYAKYLYSNRSKTRFLNITNNQNVPFGCGETLSESGNEPGTICCGVVSGYTSLTDTWNFQSPKTCYRNGTKEIYINTDKGGGVTIENIMFDTSGNVGGITNLTVDNVMLGTDTSGGLEIPVKLGTADIPITTVNGIPSYGLYFDLGVYPSDAWFKWFLNGVSAWNMSALSGDVKQKGSLEVGGHIDQIEQSTENTFGADVRLINDKGLFVDTINSDDIGYVTFGEEIYAYQGGWFNYGSGATSLCTLGAMGPLCVGSNGGMSSGPALPIVFPFEGGSFNTASLGNRSDYWYGLDAVFAEIQFLNITTLTGGPTGMSVTGNITAENITALGSITSTGNVEARGFVKAFTGLHSLAGGEANYFAGSLQMAGSGADSSIKVDHLGVNDGGHDFDYCDNCIVNSGGQYFGADIRVDRNATIFGNTTLSNMKYIPTNNIGVCDVGIRGQTIYNDTGNILMLCNGSQWLRVSTGVI